MIQLFEESIFESNEIEQFIILYAPLLIFTVVFSFTFEKYIIINIIENKNMETKRTLMDIIEYLEVAYILSDQQNILFKNKQVNQLIEIVQYSIEGKQFLLEEGIF